MITLSPTTSLQPNSVYCVAATGYSGSIDVVAQVDGRVVPTEVSYHNGVATICIKIPKHAKETVQISVADDKNEGFLVKII